MPLGITSPVIPARILLLADIHGNFPALAAIDRELNAASFDFVVNCGDSIVYAPFPNETLSWLSRHKAISILGNTDKKVIDLLKGKPFKKPRNPEKRIMYTSTAEALDDAGRRTLSSFAEAETLVLQRPDDVHDQRLAIGIFHGSPADPDEFLFADTPDRRFHEIATGIQCRIVITGHSHSPYHKFLSDTHFINPGSAGRMFDGDAKASCAILDISEKGIKVEHRRFGYNIAEVVAEIERRRLPKIYSTMFLQGRKLN
jgi:predicted phosphodiesterase